MQYFFIYFLRGKWAFLLFAHGVYAYDMIGVHIVGVKDEKRRVCGVKFSFARFFVFARELAGVRCAGAQRGAGRGGERHGIDDRDYSGEEVRREHSDHPQVQQYRPLPYIRGYPSTEGYTVGMYSIIECIV